jgi:membrane associated rhomboid family serine protease
MQSERTFIDTLKYQFRHGGMTMKLLFINLIVFLLVGVTTVTLHLMKVDAETIREVYLSPALDLHPTFWGFLRHPWGIFTYMFVHYDLLHVAMNMLFFYFAGRMFEQLFDSKRLLATYLLGGLLGALLEIIAHEVFPLFMGTNVTVVGASGAVMAVFVAVAFYRPNTQVMFFGIFPLRIIWLAVLFIVSDLISLHKGDGIAHFAHLGGAIVGMVSVQNAHNSNNIVLMFQRFLTSIQNLFKRNKSPRLKKTVTPGSTRKTDEEYNMEAKARQEQIDRILDKISKSGYESLSKKEKDFLFNQSKK